MNVFGISLLPLWSAVTIAWQDAPRVVVGPNARVRGDTTRIYIEPHLAVNAHDPSNLIAVSFRADSTWYRVVVFASLDGGRTWHESELTACDFDPWVVFLPSGDALVSCLGRTQGPTPVLVFRSSDGGHTWSGPAQVPLERGSFDHPAIVVNATGADGRGTVYVVAMQSVRSSSGRVLSGPALSKSLDGGATFAAPLRLQTSNVWANTLNPVALPNGAVGFGFIDYAVDSRGGADSGDVRQLRTPRTWGARSDDEGRTLSLPHLMTEVHEVSSGHIAVDDSRGGYRSRLYYAMDDFREDAGGVFILRSHDLGETWSTPTRLSRDAARRVRRRPTAAVSTNGHLIVAWFDPRGDPSRRCWQLVVSASVDGGASFGPARPVADSVSCNDQPGNLVPRPAGPFNVASRWPEGGDYFGLVALPDGSFRAIWADSRTGLFQLWTALITVDGR